MGSMSSPVVQLNVRQNETAVKLVKLPEFVVENWQNVQPGAIVGFLVDKRKRKAPQQPEYHDDVIGHEFHLANHRIKKLNCQNIKKDQRGLVLSTSDVEDPVKNCHLEGVCSNTLVFVPDMSDKNYLNYLASRSDTTTGESAGTVANADRGFAQSQTTQRALPKTPKLLSAAETAALARKLREEGGSGSGLFQYYNSSALTAGAALTPHGRSTAASSTVDSDTDNEEQNRGKTSTRSLARGCALSFDDAQRKLFAFLEKKGPDGANLREVQQHLGSSQSFAKQVLDVIAEPNREKQGKRLVFVLKSQFRA